MIGGGEGGEFVLKIIVLFSVLDRLDELNYRHVNLSGHFDHTKEVHMWPRKLVNKFSSSQNEETGAIIITPFYCNETQ